MDLHVYFYYAGSSCSNTVMFLSLIPLGPTTFSYFAVYEAGKAVKKGVASQYAPTIYAPSMYGQPAYSGALMTQPGMPLLPLPNGVGAGPPQSSYGREYDAASSGNSCVLFL